LRNSYDERAFASIGRNGFLEAAMEHLLFDLKLTRSQAETAIRWVAMSIAATPKSDRPSKYGEARRSVERIVDRYGLKGVEAANCITQTMMALDTLVGLLELRRKSDGWANAA
jgi:hypothetical protein